MTNANSFHSALIVLAMFAVIYFVALAGTELKKWLKKIASEKKEKKEKT